jgi:Glycosyltransferase like family 2
MLDDGHAEHVPGCNMAFAREKLLALGGFDPQFRQAGDDVDVCWRWLDAGWKIGYAPEAMVWHHRRNTVRAYLKQQKGYGRAEAMVLLKHPQRANDFGRSRCNAPKGKHFRPRRPGVGGAMIVHYDEPKNTASFPAAAPAAKRRGRRPGKKRSGVDWGVASAKTRDPPRQARRWPNLSLRRQLWIIGVG